MIRSEKLFLIGIDIIVTSFYFYVLTYENTRNNYYDIKISKYKKKIQVYKKKISV